MSSTLPSTEIGGAILKTPQQLLLGENVPESVLFQLGRACTAHCVSAAQELIGDSGIPRQSLVDFILKYGASSGSDLYIEGNGWNSVALADLMRLNGHAVVNQNMLYEPSRFNLSDAAQRGRVRSSQEKTKLVLLSDYGGSDRTKWVEAFSHTLDSGGLVISSIQIPLLSGDGYGLHSVVISGLDEDAGEIQYFDPDMYNLDRYGSNPPNISRIDSDRLFFKRPVGEHLGYMTGEVMHVFPSK